MFIYQSEEICFSPSNDFDSQYKCISNRRHETQEGEWHLVKNLLQHSAGKLFIWDHLHRWYLRNGLQSLLHPSKTRSTSSRDSLKGKANLSISLATVKTHLSMAIFFSTALIPQNPTGTESVFRIFEFDQDLNSLSGLQLNRRPFKAKSSFV